MNQTNTAEQRHRDFVQKQLTQSAISANAEAAELIAERIAAKLAEQNEIFYQVGQGHGRTTAIAYVSLRRLVSSLDLFGTGRGFNCSLDEAARLRLYIDGC